MEFDTLCPDGDAVTPGELRFGAEAPGPVTALLRQLWQRAGQPKTRAVAAASRGAVSDASVYRVLVGLSRRPRWGTAAAAATALGATDHDLADLRTAWESLKTPAPSRQATGTVQAAEAMREQTAAVADLAAAVRQLTQAVAAGQRAGR